MYWMALYPRSVQCLPTIECLRGRKRGMERSQALGGRGGLALGSVQCLPQMDCSKQRDGQALCPAVSGAAPPSPQHATPSCARASHTNSMVRRSMQHPAECNTQLNATPSCERAAHTNSMVRRSMPDSLSCGRSRDTMASHSSCTAARRRKKESSQCWMACSQEVQGSRQPVLGAAGLTGRAAAAAARWTGSQLAVQASSYEAVGKQLHSSAAPSHHMRAVPSKQPRGPNNNTYRPQHIRQMHAPKCLGCPPGKGSSRSSSTHPSPTSFTLRSAHIQVLCEHGMVWFQGPAPCHSMFTGRQLQPSGRTRNRCRGTLAGMTTQQHRWALPLIHSTSLGGAAQATHVMWHNPSKPTKTAASPPGGEVDLILVHRSTHS